jgi:PAS domain-containing protein
MSSQDLDALRPLFDCLDDGVCVSDANGRLLYANAAAERLLGPAAREAVADSLCGPLCGTAALECPLRIPRGPQAAVTYEGRTLRIRCLRAPLPSGERRFILIQDVSA